MRIIFTDAAVRDIAELRAYLEPLNPAALRRVMRRLEDLISIIPANPRIGRLTPREGVRELVEPKYGFLIPYAIIDRDVFILRLYRSKRRLMDYDDLQVP